MRKLNFVIDDASATATDNFKTLREVIYIGQTLAKQVPVCRYIDVQADSVIYKATAAEQLQIQVVTYTNTPTTNGITYALTISSLNPINESYYTKTYTITTPTTGTVSANSIAVQMNARINADATRRVNAALVGDTTSLTAITGYAAFTINASVVGLGVSIATPTTAGIYPFGKTPYYDLQRTGLTSADYAGSSAGYGLFRFTAGVPKSDNTYAMQDWTQVNVFVNTDDASAAALIAAIRNNFDDDMTVLNVTQLMTSD